MPDLNPPPLPDADTTPEGVPIPRFTPWTGERRRGSGWTADAQRGFIAALTRYGCVAAAAQAVGRSTRSAYRLRDRRGAESFAAAWASAQIAGQQMAQQVAIERGLHGTLAPQFREGRFIGYRVVRDERLLAAAVFNRPEQPLHEERYRLEQWEASLRRLEMDLIDRQAGGGTPEPGDVGRDTQVFLQEMKRLERKRRDTEVRKFARKGDAALHAPPQPRARAL